MLRKSCYKTLMPPVRTHKSQTCALHQVMANYEERKRLGLVTPEQEAEQQLLLQQHSAGPQTSPVTSPELNARIDSLRQQSVVPPPGARGFPTQAPPKKASQGLQPPKARVTPEDQEDVRVKSLKRRAGKMVRKEKRAAEMAGTASRPHGFG